MKDNLTLGQTGQARHIVNADLTAQAMGSGSVPVYATPALLALMEAAAVDALAPSLEDDETSVGIQATLDHLAATPIGMNVRAEATITAIQGRQITFQVTAWDDADEIGRGTHQRMVVETAKFMARATAKQPKSP